VSEQGEEEGEGAAAEHSGHLIACRTILRFARSVLSGSSAVRRLGPYTRSRTSVAASVRSIRTTVEATQIPYATDLHAD
jgi:hypothetical protein